MDGRKLICLMKTTMEAILFIRSENRRSDGARRNVSIDTQPVKGIQIAGLGRRTVKKFAQLEKLYEGMTEELFENLTYFLEKVIPVCKKQM